MVEDDHKKTDGSKLNEFELKIDSQVEKFLEVKQKFTYFLVSAAVVVAVFVFNQAEKKTPESFIMLIFLIASGLSGIVAAGCSLLSIHFEIISYRMHIHYRYKRKTWDTLDDKSKQSWDRSNHKAKAFFSAAMICLFCEILFAILFLIWQISGQSASGATINEFIHHKGRGACITMEKIR